MSRFRNRFVGAALCAAGFAATASAQWSDNFDSYVAGSVINGQGGWQQWDNVANTTSVVSNAFARSAPNSVGIFSTGPAASQTSDLVQRFANYTSGQWTLTSWVYIPGPNSPNPLVDTVFFLVLNTYNDFGPYNWSVEVDLRPATSDWAIFAGSGTPVVGGPLITDQWVEIRAEIDLNNDLVEVFYDGVSMAPPYSWTGGVFGGGGGQLAIEALDLYHNPGTTPNSGAYWDDVSLSPGGCPALLNFCTAGTTSGGCAATISGSGTPSATAPSGFTISLSNAEPLKQGILFYGIDNNGFTPQPWGTGTSFLCVKAPVQRMGVQNTGGTSGNCDGTLATDWNAFVAANPGTLGAPFAAGAQVYAQGWFRDPPSPKTTSLSNGLSFIVCP